MRAQSLRFRVYFLTLGSRVKGLGLRVVTRHALELCSDASGCGGTVCCDDDVGQPGTAAAPAAVCCDDDVGQPGTAAAPAALRCTSTP